MSNYVDTLLIIYLHKKFWKNWVSKTFNQALLTKNGWRLISNPDSLWAKLLKAKYFPNLDFLASEKSPKSFYLWSSLVWGKELLVHGIGCELSNGRNTLAWRDNWIPFHNFFKSYVNKSDQFSGYSFESYRLTNKS